MILVGVCLGFFAPGEQPEPSREQAAAPGTSIATVAAAAPAPRTRSRAPGWRSETRLTQGPGGHYKTSALVNGQPVSFIVDTGATTVALTLSDARRIGIAVDPRLFDEVGMGAGGPVRGQHVLIDSISLDGREVRGLRGVVLEGLQESLLGQSFLGQIGEVTIRSGVMILR